jgi:uncharacterized protein YjiS (DUF1127 family)
MVSQTTQQANSLIALLSAISWIGRTLTALVQEVWQIADLIDRRRQLSRLGDQDDRMLADVGLSRCDLTTALSAPLWQDPTAILKRRRGNEAAVETEPQKEPRSTYRSQLSILPAGSQADRYKCLLRAEQTQRPH